MAKKSSQDKNSVPHKKMTKLITPVKSPTSGTYSFKEEMILLDQLDQVLAQRKK